MDKKIKDEKRIYVNMRDCPDCKGTGKAPKGLIGNLVQMGGGKPKDCKRCEGLGKIPIK